MLVETEYQDLVKIPEFLLLRTFFERKSTARFYGVLDILLDCFVNFRLFWLGITIGNLGYGWHCFKMDDVMHGNCTGKNILCCCKLRYLLFYHKRLCIKFRKTGFKK